MPAPDLRTRAGSGWTGWASSTPGRDRATPHGLDLDVRPGRGGRAGRAERRRQVDRGAGPARPAPSDAGRVRDPGPSPTAGDATADLADLDPASWSRQVAWVPQRPLLVPGTLADNVRLAAPAAPPTRTWRPCRRAATGLDDVVAALPRGWRTRDRPGGHGLSAGQRQRLALARALLRPAPLVVLDEPTAHLDAGTEQVVHDAVRRLRDAGRAVVLVAHRPALVALADRVVTVPRGAGTRRRTPTGTRCADGRHRPPMRLDRRERAR